MKVKIISLLICVLLITMASGYYCIYEEDNDKVKEFKSKLNQLAIESDLNEGVSEEAIKWKIQLLHPCK